MLTIVKCFIMNTIREFFEKKRNPKNTKHEQLKNERMKVIIFGSTGMVGKGILLECLDSHSVEKVLVVNRRSLNMSHDKLEEIVYDNYEDFSAIQDRFKGFDACFFPLGVSALGLSEESYTKITYDLTLRVAKIMLQLNPDMVFTYVSGVGTDSTEKGRQMWARVKGRTENDLLKMGFKRAYMFRPGYIQPKRGIRSRTSWYNLMYVLFSWIYPIIKTLAPNSATSTIDVGKAMIQVVLDLPESGVIDVKGINELANRFKG